MDEIQSSTKQSNGVLSCLGPNNISRLAERCFVDDGESQKNELCRSGSVRTRRRIYNAEKGTYKPVFTSVYNSVFIRF